MDPKFVINDKTFVFGITLEQDELLGEIVYNMIKEVPDTLTKASEGMIDASDVSKSVDQKMRTIVNVALDMIKVHAWIYMKGYAKRILAIILVPEGEEFDASKVDERAIFFGKHADRETANEVINFFFQRSGAFGIGTQAFLPAVEKK